MEDITHKYFFKVIVFKVIYRHVFLYFFAKLNIHVWYDFYLLIHCSLSPWFGLMAFQVRLVASSKRDS